MVDPTRKRVLRNEPISDGRYVLYWMQASQRTRFNHALEYAIEQANELGLPLLVGFGLMDDYPEANARHYAFLLEGLRDVEVNLAKRGIRFVLRRGQPFDVAIKLTKDAALVVCDRGYLRQQKQWRDQVADECGRRVVEVESDVVVPVEAASDKDEYAARTLRPKIHRKWEAYLNPLPAAKVKHSSLKLDLKNDLDLSDSLAALTKLNVDRSVMPTTRLIGGENEAHGRLTEFIRMRLAGYAEKRNEPKLAHSSMLSAYLHFGHISPVEIALKVTASSAPSADRDSYLEELIVRRELAMNFVNFNPLYDSYACLPNWAQKTLSEHRRDPREHVYSRQQLEAARTHDPYWNAAQREMTQTGFMHNYMRMYWGKKILEWSKTPEEAFATTLHLNNKHFLDGRDPNSFANVAWIYGLHDRPWGPPRKIFGTVRYMNSAGMDRKFDMDGYVAWVAGLK